MHIFEFWSHLENPLQDTSSGHASFQVINFTAGFVHVERSDNWNTRNQKHHKLLDFMVSVVTVLLVLTDESGLRREVSDGHRDHFNDVLTNHLNVVLQLGWDGNDGSSLCHCACSTKMKKKVKELNLPTALPWEVTKTAKPWDMLELQITFM